MTDAERYAVTVRKVRVDDQEMWRATVRELPDLAEFAETREEAIDLMMDSIESLKATAAEDGRSFPEPLEEEEEYSGRVTLRLPKFLHREVALKALDDGVSLNSYIIAKLAWNAALVAREESVYGGTVPFYFAGACAISTLDLNLGAAVTTDVISEVTQIYLDPRDSDYEVSFGHAPHRVVGSLASDRRRRT